MGLQHVTSLQPPASLHTFSGGPSQGRCLFYGLKARDLFMTDHASFVQVINAQLLTPRVSSNIQQSSSVCNCQRRQPPPRSYVHEPLLSTVVSLASGQAAGEGGYSRVQAVHTTARGPPHLSRGTQVACRHLPTIEVGLRNVHLPYATRIEGAIHHAVVEPHRPCRVLGRLTHFPRHLQAQRLREWAQQAANLNLPRSGQI